MSIADRLDGLWKVVKLSAFLLGSLGLVVLLVVGVRNECTDDGVRIEPVTVKALEEDKFLTPELAVQHVSGYLVAIVASGAEKWSQIRLDDPSPDYSVQIPGTSFTVESVIREIASFFPSRRRVLNISITPGLKGADYEAKLTISNGGKMTVETCSTDINKKSSGKPALLDGLFECLAVKAMQSVDLLYAAAYELKVEAERCKNLEELIVKPKDDSAESVLANEDAYIEQLRGRCGFEATRGVVAEIVRRGRPADQIWVPYFFGKFRLTRAEALGDVDPPAQWYEFKRAHARFQESSEQSQEYRKGTTPDTSMRCGPEKHSDGAVVGLGGKSTSIGHSVLVAKIGAEIQRAIAFHGGAAREYWDRANKDAPWPDDKAVQLLNRAKDSLGEADKDLARIQQTNDPLVPHLQGLIQYRRWMMLMNEFQGAPLFRVMTGPGDAPPARLARENPQKAKEDLEKEVKDGSAKEKVLLDNAAAKFEAAFAQGRITEQLFLDWGNALWAAREFDCAFEKHLSAGEIAPGDSAPLLNAAIALLGKVTYAEDNQVSAGMFEAMQAVADHLSWVSTGGPYGFYIDRIDEAMARWDQGRKDNLLKAPFEACMAKHTPPAEPKDAVGRLERAQLKLCIGQATQTILKEFSL